VAILVVSLALLLIRPQYVPEWAAALGGGILLVVVGALPVPDALGNCSHRGTCFCFFSASASPRPRRIGLACFERSPKPRHVSVAAARRGC
jgi:hypothetical protein